MHSRVTRSETRCGDGGSKEASPQGATVGREPGRDAERGRVRGPAPCCGGFVSLDMTAASLCSS
jgi:hypothetical protein